MAILRKGNEYQLWVIPDQTGPDYLGECMADKIGTVLNFHRLKQTQGCNEITKNGQTLVSCSVVPYKTMWFSRKSFWPISVKKLYIWKEV